MTISIPMKICNANGGPLSLAQHLEFSAEAEAIALSKSIDLPDSEIEPYFAVARMHLVSAAAVDIASQGDALAAIDRVIRDIRQTVADPDYTCPHLDGEHVDLLQSVRRHIDAAPPATHTSDVE